MCAFRFGDGFDKYSAVSQLARNWTDTTANFTLVTGRFGGLAVSMVGQFLQHSFGADISTLIVGFSYKRTATGTGSPIYIFKDGTTNQCGFYQKPDGRIEFRRGTLTALGVTTFVLPVNVWVHFESKVTIDNTVGSFELRINGVVVLLVTGVDTSSTANNFANSIVVGPTTGVGDFQIYDDFYILDTTGIGPLNDFLGEVRVKTQFPSAAGVTTDFGVVGAASNFDAVNDVASGDDTKYVTAGNVGNRDTYEISDVAASDTIKTVQICHLARKTDAGVATLKPVIISGATTDVPALGVGLSETYNYIRTVTSLDPNTGLPWTAADFNAVKIGQEFAIV